jgi:hypothetical protein
MRTPHMVSILTLSACLVAACNSQVEQPPKQVPEQAQASTAGTEPAEPCRVEAPPEAQAAALNWCREGVFRVVRVSTDSGAFVASLTFSKKGQGAWDTNKPAILESFRGMTDEMAKAHVNVAFSLHDTGGRLIGGCARKGTDSESICK